MTGWTLRTRHAHCTRCADLADQARVLATVNGSVAATQRDEYDGRITHAGTAERHATAAQVEAYETVEDR